MKKFVRRTETRGNKNIRKMTISITVIRPITKRSDCNDVITFDSDLKTAL